MTRRLRLSFLTLSTLLTLSAACGESSSLESQKGRGSEGALPSEVARAIQSIQTSADVSGPIPVNSSPVAGETQLRPAVAQGPGVYFVAWEVNSSATGSSSDIVGVRVRASDGALLDSSPILIATGSYSQTEPAVAFDGTHFLVLWTEDQGVPAIYGRRVNAADGSLVDSAAFVVSKPLGGGPQQRGQTTASVACDANACLVGWYDIWVNEDGSGYRFVEMTFLRASDATLLEGGPRVLTTTGAAAPRVTSGGGYFAVSWVDGTNLKVSLYDSRMMGSWGPITVTTSADAQSPAIAGQAGEFLVTWLEAGNILARRVAVKNSALLGSANTLVGANALASPSVAADGADYRVLWTSLRNGVPRALSTRVSALGELAVNAEFDLGDAGLYRGDIAAPSSGLSLAAYVANGATGEPRVYVKRVTDGQVRIPSQRDVDPLRTMFSPHHTPTVGTGNGINLVLWHQSGNGGMVLRGLRVRASDGQVLDSAPLLLSTDFYGLDPAVAFDGTNFLVVWVRLSSAPAIFGMRVRASDGALLDSAPFLISVLPAGAPVSEMRAPSVATNGWIYMITWDGRYGPDSTGAIPSGVQGIQVLPSGMVLGSSYLIAKDGKDSRVSYSNNKFLVTWERNQNIEAARVDPSSGRLEGNTVISLAASPGYERSAAVAAQGDNFLVAWVGADNNLWARRVSASSGALLDSGNIAVGSAPLSGPEVISDGADFWIGWQGTRNGQRQLLGTRVSALGTAEAEVSIASVDSSTSQSIGSWLPQFGIASAAPGSLTVAYLQYDPTMGYSATRFRLVSTNSGPVLPLASESRVSREGCIYAFQARQDRDPYTYSIFYRLVSAVWPDASGTCTVKPNSNSLGTSQYLPAETLLTSEAGIAVGYTEANSYRGIGTISNGFVAQLHPETAGIMRRVQLHMGSQPTDCGAGGPGSIGVNQISIASDSSLVVDGWLVGNIMTVSGLGAGVDFTTPCDGSPVWHTTYTATFPGFFTTPQAATVVLH
ncbi:hypothetical protein [Hyalangium versicolor]|uniref:hypothetical protein n=1 Tax=Hyalangium versicolor TaxID=2861190 RepID=UPI001CCFBB14|nr:hypothetical protein [Hyalangium versicolor]